MSERDPRVDPMPGDVLAVRDPDPMVPPEKRTVDALSPNGYGLRWSGLLRETSKSYLTSMKQWRKWAATAEVVNRAEEQNAEIL